MSPEIAYVVLVPLFGAVVSALISRRFRGSITAGFSLLTLLAAFAVARAVAQRGTLHHPVGAWSPPLGIRLHADGFAALALLIFSCVGVGISLYASSDSALAPRLRRSFFALWFFGWSALNALLLSADVFNLYVTLELTTLAAIALIALDGARPALTAGLRYLLVALSGSLVYLLGVGLLYGAHATLDLTLLGERAGAGAATWAGLALMTLGMCLKGGLFPLHGWLPPAYVSARPVVAALLSALIAKGPFIVVLKLWFSIVPSDFALSGESMLGALGAAGVIGGSLLAWRQQHLRPLIAYSSVAQIGYLFLIFPLSSAEAWAGGIYLMISHAAAKAALFLSSGLIERASGSDALADLGGLARRLPITFFSLALAGMSLMGMPPSGGFVAKWLLIRAAFQTGQWWLGVIILAGGLLAAGYMFKTLRHAFVLTGTQSHLVAVSRKAELAAFMLAVLSLLLGLAPSLPLELLQIGRPL